MSRPEPGQCAVCGAHGTVTPADWEVAFADGQPGFAACAGHLSESAAMVMASQSADHVILYGAARTGG